jgi:hypothetical protein
LRRGAFLAHVAAGLEPDGLRHPPFQLAN